MKYTKVPESLCSIHKKEMGMNRMTANRGIRIDCVAGENLPTVPDILVETIYISLVIRKTLAKRFSFFDMPCMTMIERINYRECSKL